MALNIQNYADQKLSAAVACLVGLGTIRQRIRSARVALLGLQVDQLPPHLHHQWGQVMLGVQPEDMSEEQAQAVAQALLGLAREVPCWRHVETGWEPGLESAPTRF